MGIFLNQLIRFYYRLEEAYIVLGIAEGFFSVITPQNLNGYGRNLEYKCRTTVRTRTKKICFFLLPIERGLSDIYPTPISKQWT